MLIRSNPTCFAYHRVPALNLTQSTSLVSLKDLLMWGSLLSRQDLPGCFLGLLDALQSLLIWGIFPGWLNFRGTEQCKRLRFCCDLCRRFPLLRLFFHSLACSYFKRQTPPSHPLWDGNDWSSLYLIFFFSTGSELFCLCALPVSLLHALQAAASKSGSLTAFTLATSLQWYSTSIFHTRGPYLPASKQLIRREELQ